jgi:hypothetical protein
VEAFQVMESQQLGGEVETASGVGDEEGHGGKKANDCARAALLDSYKQFTSFHSTQETLFWTRNNLLVLMQVGLIAALFALLGRKQPDPWHLIPVGTCGIALVGLGLTRAWILMVERSRYLFDVALSILAETERELLEKPQLGLFTLFYEASKTEADDKMVRALPSAIEARLNSEFKTQGRALRLSTMWIRVGRGFAVAWGLTLLADLLYVIWAFSACGAARHLPGCGAGT